MVVNPGKFHYMQPWYSNLNLNGREMTSGNNEKLLCVLIDKNLISFDVQIKPL